MSDEFDFDFGTDPVETPPAPTEPPAPAAPTGPSAEEFNALQTRLANAERFQQDAQRFFSGNQQQPPNPQDEFQKFLQDPNGFKSEIIQNAVTLARQEMAEQQAVAKIESEFPELAYLKNLVDWGQLMQQTAPQFQQKHGRIPSLEEALRESATFLKEKLQGTGANPQVNREVLRLTPGNGSAPPVGLDPSSMTDAQWFEYRKANGF